MLSERYHSAVKAKGSRREQLRSDAITPNSAVTKWYNSLSVFLANVNQVNGCHERARGAAPKDYDEKNVWLQRIPNVCLYELTW